MQLFFHPLADNDHIVFSAEEAKHIKVLRKKEGDQIHCTNGEGLHSQFEIIAIEKNDIHCRISEKKIIQASLPPLTIAISPLKNPDRFEWFVEKSVEMGVSSIIPIICDRTEKQKLRIDRLEKKIIASSLQSINFNFAKISEPISFLQLTETAIAEQKFIPHCIAGEKNSLFHQLRQGVEAIILIGPEGDFTETEVEWALKHGFRASSLGNTRLRSETAGVYSAATFSIKNS